MSARTVYDNGRAVGEVVKYVGETARTMGSDPAYAAHPENRDDYATVHASWSAARDHLIARARWHAASRDASLGVGHAWTAVSCPAYRSLNGADCTCNAAR